MTAISNFTFHTTLIFRKCMNNITWTLSQLLKSDIKQVDADLQAKLS